MLAQRRHAARRIACGFQRPQWAPCDRRAEPEEADVPKEQQLRERFECLEALTAAVRTVLGEARNYTGWQPQQLQLPVDDAAVRVSEVCAHILPVGF
jgi:hypothetical protein